MKEYALLLVLVAASAGNAQAVTLNCDSVLGSDRRPVRRRHQQYLLDLDGGGYRLSVGHDERRLLHRPAASPIPDTVYAANGQGCLRTYNVVTAVDTLVGFAGAFIPQIGYDARHNILYGTGNSCEKDRATLREVRATC